MGDGGMKVLSSTARQIIFWLLIIAGALLIYKLVNPGTKNTTNIDLTALEQKIQHGELSQLTVKTSETAAVEKNTGKNFVVQLANEHTKAEILKEAREPDQKWKLSAKAVAEFQATQSTLLAEVAAQVKPGARIVYATCSVLPEENDAVVEGFLQKRRIAADGQFSYRLSKDSAEIGEV